MIRYQERQTQWPGRGDRPEAGREPIGPDPATPERGEFTPASVEQMLSDAELAALHAQDRKAATVIVSLLLGIFAFGIVSGLVTYFSVSLP